MNRKHQLANLQLAIMQVLWDLGEATVAQVREALERDPPLAYTTVATMLTKMERNGQVAHRQEGRVLVYYPALGQQAVRRSMVSDLATRLFRGDVTQMVSHLLDGCPIDAQELAELQTMIRQKESELNDAV